MPGPIKAVVFDLDGTLIDSLPDLAGALNRSLARHNQPPLDRPTVSAMVGDGAKILLKKGYAAHNLTPTDEDESIFMADYEAHVTDLTECYPGIEQALETLATGGYHLAICTNKPEASARKVLKALKLDHFFPTVIGADGTQYRKPDPRHLEAVLTAMNATKDHAVMIGDHANDIATARGLGVPAIFVTWGYGHSDEPRRIDQASALPAAVTSVFGAVG